MVESWQHRSMRDILRVVFSRWLTALLILAIVVGAAAAGTWMLPKVFEAQVRLTSPLSEGEQKLAGDSRGDSTLEIRLKMQYDVLTGDTVLSRVLARADNPRLTAEADIAAAAAKITTGRQDRIKELRRSVRMETTGGQATSRSLSFALFVRADSARQSKLLADLLTEEFISRYHELLRKQLEARFNVARDEVAAMVDDPDSDYSKARGEWAAKMNRYSSQAEAASVLSLLNKGPNVDVGMARGQAQALQEYVRVKSELEGVKAIRQRLNVSVEKFSAAVNAGNAEVEMLPFVPAEFGRQTAITRISETLADKYSLRAQLRSTYKEDPERPEQSYQPLVHLRKEVNLLEKELLRLFRSELEGLAATEARLASQIVPLKEYGGEMSRSEQVENLGTFLAGLQEADARWTNQLKLYEDRQKRMIDAQTRYQETIKNPQIVTMDGAVEPDSPIRPIVWLNLLVGAIVGVLLALTYLFLADYYDHSVRSTDDVERYLGVPVLASVGRQIRRPVHA